MLSLRSALRASARMPLRTAAMRTALPAAVPRAYSTGSGDSKLPLVDSENELVYNEDKLGHGIAEVSGAPHELTERTVRIFKQAPSATQSGRRQQKGWRLNWDVVPRANRWEDTTIGYASSGDYMQATEIHFHTKDDAIRFAKNQGWNYYVQEPKERTFKPKSYAENFFHSPGPLKMIWTK